MRIRPAYWLLLVVCCLCTFGFACLWQEHVPAMLHIQVIQQEQAEEVMMVVQLTDPQGLPLDGVRVKVNAIMPDMQMSQSFTYSEQQVKIGCYKIHLILPMSGRWLITSSAEAANFVASPQKLMVTIASQPPQSSAHSKIASCLQ